MAERERPSYWVSRLQEHAMAVGEEWVSGVLSELQASDDGTGVAAMSDAKVFNALFTAFLFCDLHVAGVATLPPNLKSLHRQVLRGRHVVQVDELVDAAAPAKERYGGGAQGTRVLKLALTDGCQQVVGVEYSRTGSLAWDCPAGSKLLLHDVPVRRGLLLLGPGNAVLLGGQVERMEAARQRAVAAWNARAEGRRRGARTLDIFTEARRAAWSPAVAPEAQNGQPQGVLSPQPHQRALSAQGQQHDAVQGTGGQAVADGSRVVAPVASAPVPLPPPLTDASPSIGGTNRSAGHAPPQLQPTHGQQRCQSQMNQPTPEAPAVAAAAPAVAAAAAAVAPTGPLRPMALLPPQAPSSSGRSSSGAARAPPPACVPSQPASQPGTQPQSRRGCPQPPPQPQPLTRSLLDQPAEQPPLQHDGWLGGSNAAQRAPSATAHQHGDIPLPRVAPSLSFAPSTSQPPSSQQTSLQQPPATAHHGLPRPWSTQHAQGTQHGGTSDGHSGRAGIEVQPRGSQPLHQGSNGVNCASGAAMEAEAPAGCVDAAQWDKASDRAMPPRREAQQLMAMNRVPQRTDPVRQHQHHQQGRLGQQPAVSPLPTCLQPSPIPQHVSASGHQPYRWQQDPGDTQQHQEAGGDMRPQHTSSWEPEPWPWCESGGSGACCTAEARPAPGGAAELGTCFPQHQRGPCSQPLGPAASLPGNSSTQVRPLSASQRSSQPRATGISTGAGTHSGQQGAGRSSQFLAGLAAYASAGSGSQQPDMSQPGEPFLPWSQRPSQRQQQSQEQQQQLPGAANTRATAARCDGVPARGPGVCKAWGIASTVGGSPLHPQGEGEGGGFDGPGPVGMEQEGQEADLPGRMGTAPVMDEPVAMDLVPLTGLEDVLYGRGDAAVDGGLCCGAPGGGGYGQVGGVSSNSLFSLSLALFD